MTVLGYMAPWSLGAKLSQPSAKSERSLLYPGHIPLMPMSQWKVPAYVMLGLFNTVKAHLLVLCFYVEDHLMQFCSCVVSFWCWLMQLQGAACIANTCCTCMMCSCCTVIVLLWLCCSLQTGYAACAYF